MVNLGQGTGQLGTNLIAFDNLTSYGSPTYYAQAMFASAHGKTIVPLSITPQASLIGSATRTISADSSSVIYLKLVNPTDAPVPAQITLQGLADSAIVSPTANLRVLKATQPSDTNTIDSPRAIVPVNTTINTASTSFSYPAPAYSVTLITLRVRGQN